MIEVFPRGIGDGKVLWVGEPLGSLGVLHGHFPLRSEVIRVHAALIQDLKVETGRTSVGAVWASQWAESHSATTLLAMQILNEFAMETSKFSGDFCVSAECEILVDFTKSL